MPFVFYSKIVGAPVDKVWGMIRDFGGLDRWFPFVSRCELQPGYTSGTVGAVRANTVADGKIIEEKLLELSDRDRKMIYIVVSGDVPTSNYSATIKVHPVSDEDASFVVWTANFDVEGDPVPIEDWVRSGIFKTCLNELEVVLQREKASQ